MPTICDATMYLLDTRKLAVRTVVQRVAAVRFLYCKTLKRRDMKEDLPYPRKYRRRLPVILSVEEVAQVIDCARSLFHRALLMTAYTCGLRRSEVCRLKISDIDSESMMIRITPGKDGIDRDVPMSPISLETYASTGGGCARKSGLGGHRLCSQERPTSANAFRRIF